MSLSRLFGRRRETPVFGKLTVFPYPFLALLRCGAFFIIIYFFLIFCSFTQSGAGDGLLRVSMRHQIVSELSGELAQVCSTVHTCVVK